MAIGMEIDSQASYHRQLFAGWYGWEEFWKAAVDLVGSEQDAVRLGLDQLGHFGPRGVSLVTDRIVSDIHGELTRVVELGSGFGGALRHMRRQLSALGMSPQLFGVELVLEHCRIANAIGRMVHDSLPITIQSDAHCLPFPSASIDAVFAAGSASHFSSVRDLLAECNRILRPGGIVVMTDEVSLRPPGGPEPGELFAGYHPPGIFHSASPEQRRHEFESANLKIEVFDPLYDWAIPLLRQRVNVLRFMGKCVTQMYGQEAYEQMVGTLTSTADSYERKTVQPTLIVARQ